ncbi:MAG TPA: hypothetical protein VI056_12070 [Candidatus Limnocylindria bacterium]
MADPLEERVRQRPSSDAANARQTAFAADSTMPRTPLDECVARAQATLGLC